MLLLLVTLFGAVVALAAAGRADPPSRYSDWQVPTAFPLPAVPPDNPLTDAKVELGRHLFYERRLSANGTQSCGSCHQQERAFADGVARSVGSTGEQHPRSSMSLVNVAYAAALNWGDPVTNRLEDQMLVPMYGEHPIELGLDRSDRWLEALAQDRRYQELFRDAFGSNGIDGERVIKAIATFERAIVSARSPYDRYHYDRDETAVSAAVKRGEVLFRSKPLSCFTCHGGANFSSSMPGALATAFPVDFHNTGLYNLPGTVSYPVENTGIYEVTRDPKDVGRFKAPTLRNIAVTAPYMHDGSIASLDEVIDHYAAGGRTIASGPYAGVGRDNPNKSPQIGGFTLAPGERQDLIAFLHSLTDEHLLKDPRFSDPWPAIRDSSGRSD